MSDTSVLAKTKITIEVEHSCGPWADDIAMAHLRKQAKREASGYADRVVALLLEQRIKARLVGVKTPTVDLGTKS